MDQQDKCGGDVCARYEGHTTRAAFLHGSATGVRGLDEQNAYTYDFGSSFDSLPVWKNDIYLLRCLRLNG